MRHQAIASPSWKQQAGNEFGIVDWGLPDVQGALGADVAGAGALSGVAGQLRAYSQSGNVFLAGEVDGNADFTVRTNILMLRTDIIF